MTPRSTLNPGRREPLIPRAPTFWLTVVLLWAAYGLLSTNQSFLFYSLTAAQAPAWSRLLKLSLGLMTVWAAVTPFVIYLARRFRVQRHNWHTMVLLHLAGALVCWVVIAALTWLLHGVLAPPRPRSFVGFALLQLDVAVFLYLVMVALTHAWDFHRWYQERGLRAVQLENQVTTSRLHVLAMQLQPHFLFNTLNAIAELVHKDADRADEMLARLGQLLRRSMENGQEQEVSLARELEFLDAYVEIERLRYGDRLVVHVDAGPDAARALVPSFLLQPLVENAIRHGTARRAERGLIAVRAARRGPVLALTVEDNGSGPEDVPPRAGVGLGNTRARLEQLYGQSWRLDLARGARGGALLAVEIPYRPAPADAVAPATGPHPPAALDLAASGA